MVDEHAVDGELAPLVDEGLFARGAERGVAPANNETLVAFEPAAFEEVSLCAGGADVGDCGGDGAGLDGALLGCHLRWGVAFDTITDDRESSWNSR